MYLFAVKSLSFFKLWDFYMFDFFYIAKKLFGENYSGLEYDYRGLLRVYTMLGDREKALMYREILHNWKELRDQRAQKEKELCPLNIDFDPVAPEDILSLLNAVQ